MGRRHADKASGALIGSQLPAGGGLKLRLILAATVAVVHANTTSSGTGRSVRHSGCCVRNLTFGFITPNQQSCTSDFDQVKENSGNVVVDVNEESVGDGYTS